MDKPVIAGRGPARVQLDAGETYYWCRCGRSKNQPFCDGSHRGTSFKPLAFKAEESGEAFLCQCKHTGKPPYCDGSHKRLPEDDAPKPEAGPPEAFSTPEEPTLAQIHELAKHGLDGVGSHGEMGAMGVPRSELPHWDDIQILPA